MSQKSIRRLLATFSASASLMLTASPTLAQTAAPKTTLKPSSSLSHFRLEDFAGVKKISPEMRAALQGATTKRKEVYGPTLAAKPAPQIQYRITGYKPSHQAPHYDWEDHPECYRDYRNMPRGEVIYIRRNCATRGYEAADSWLGFTGEDGLGELGNLGGALDVASRVAFPLQSDNVVCRTDVDRAGIEDPLAGRRHHDGFRGSMHCRYRF